MSGNPYERPGQFSGLAKPGWSIPWVSAIVVCSVIAFLFALSLPFGRMPRGAARRTQCKNNLKQIALALHNYADVHHALPPAYTVDAKGQPLHSWRALILPYPGEQELYDSIDLARPWDDPLNAEAREAGPLLFRCPASEIPENHTTYVGLVGANSCLHPSRPRPFSEITDGTAETLMVIESSPERSIHWMMPRDGGAEVLSRTETATELAHTGGTQAAFADGRVRFLSAEIPYAERQSMLSIAEGTSEMKARSRFDHRLMHAVSQTR